MVELYLINKKVCPKAKNNQFLTILRLSGYLSLYLTAYTRIKAIHYGRFRDD
jgi:hypothetical protein